MKEVRIVALHNGATCDDDAPPVYRLVWVATRDARGGMVHDGGSYFCRECAPADLDVSSDDVMLYGEGLNDTGFTGYPVCAKCKRVHDWIIVDKCIRCSEVIDEDDDVESDEPTGELVCSACYAKEIASRTFKIDGDGEPGFTGAAFLADNADFRGRELQRIARLASGQECRIGGGAQGETVILRIA